MAEVNIHATCVAVGPHGVLLLGKSGAGKSDLALRLIDGGAMPLNYIAASGASIIKTHDADGSDYLYTLLVPADANQLFPCFDQPDLKARVTLDRKSTRLNSSHT